MKPEQKMIDAISTHKMLEMLLETYDFYFPAGQRARYEKIALKFESENQAYWLERLNAKKQAIVSAFKSLREWADMTDSDLLISAWDDEVFFFYILRTQFLFSRLAASKETEMIPGLLDAFWAWGMTPKDDEPWMLFPVFTAQNIAKASNKPPIWKVPYPDDYPKFRL